jgi:hypothetical protein
MSIGKSFKGLSPSTTPFGKRKSIRIVELTIPKVTTLSIEKRDCEKYLFQWVCGEELVLVETKIIDLRLKGCTVGQK